jgi:hypothetical protein
MRLACSPEKKRRWPVADGFVLPSELVQRPLENQRKTRMDIGMAMDPLAGLVLDLGEHETIDPPPADDVAGFAEREILRALGHHMTR